MQLFNEALDLLKQLIAIPSLSKEEDKTADLIQTFFQDKGISTQRKGNNIWVKNLHFDAGKPTILLNSHHDTVKPNVGYTKDPFSPEVKDGKLYGLGSNDAGASLVSLMACFLNFYNQPDLKYNLILAASAEEEISGKNGVESILEELGDIDFAIVGEPTLLDLAIAEKGLMVLDCVATGKSGHAARNEGENAIYKAMKDLEWFRTYSFNEVSKTLGPVQMSVTMINAGQQHNVVPDECKFVVDVRSTDCYSNTQILEIVRANVKSKVEPRSTRLNPSSIPVDHPIVQAGIALGRRTYGSPTMSDQALMPYPSLKLGVGDSARSHTADEFVFIHEIEEGIEFYIQLLKQVL
ncbi:M20 family metallo-hydrolase [Roseivirga sp.]|uniref:M20 family metallo-hydrolase n=1 Tax=Roseivirga sp. TaxID=1964215 RepID=UPI002B26BDD4|nr:M20 family metallo-hydrolase [Roseivirga sp.]